MSSSMEERLPSVGELLWQILRPVVSAAVSFFACILFSRGAWFFWWFNRYFRLIVHTVSHWTYRSMPIPLDPSYSSKDVTVIIPTIHNNFEELKESVQSILACQPYELLFVTTSDKYNKLVHFAKSLEASNVRVFHVPIANKRIQVCEAIPHVKTSITIMADDDVTWPHTILPWLLAPFEDKAYGGVGPCQRVKRIRSGPVSAFIYNWLGAAYIERRNFEISATHGIDGGTSCMSGRTCAFRSEILKSGQFLEGFKTERWGRYQLNADDDNFVTRWLVSHQWKTYIQYHPQCEIETTLENNMKFLYQCSRWARSNWRSNFTSLVTERYVWKQQMWSTYALHIATFTSLTLAFDPYILWMTYKHAPQLEGYSPYFFVYLQLSFMFLTKIVKLIGLFRRNPVDVIYLPVSIVFGYFHSLIKIYAGLTLRMTSWGSRADGDTNDNARMSPRACRSESITLPPGNQPGLPRYQDEKEFSADTTTSSSRQHPLQPSASHVESAGCDGLFDAYDECGSRSDGFSESDLDCASDDGYDGNASSSSSSSGSLSSSLVIGTASARPGSELGSGSWTGMGLDNTSGR